MSIELARMWLSEAVPIAGLPAPRWGVVAAVLLALIVLVLAWSPNQHAFRNSFKEDHR